MGKNTLGFDNRRALQKEHDARRARQYAKGPSPTVANYIGSLNLEDTKEHRAKTRDIGDKDRRKMEKAIKNSPSFKKWKKLQKTDHRWPGQTFDKEGNRIYRGDTESQAVYDSYDAGNSLDIARSDAYSEDFGFEMNAADRWAWKHRNAMKRASKYSEDKGLDKLTYPSMDGNSPNAFINPFEGQTSDFFEYSPNKGPKNRKFDTRASPEALAEFGRRTGNPEWFKNAQATRHEVAAPQPTKAEASIIANPYEAPASTINAPYNTSAMRANSAGQKGIIGNTKAGDKVYNPKTTVREKVQKRMVARRSQKRQNVLSRSKERIQ
jgi:hypothetical protein